MSISQIDKRKQKEAKELVILKKKEQQSLAFLKYMGIIMAIVTVIYVVDEITSNMGVMRTFMIYDLFKVPGATTTAQEYSDAVSKMSIASIPTYLITILLPLYKSLSDRFGRKLFLVLNTMGMGLGLLICMTAPNYIWFIIGTVTWGFFTPNDMQVIYIMEVAPTKHRAKLCSITKGIALLSVSLIGVFRTIFYDPADLTSWRMVYLVPVILAFTIGLLAIFLTRETPVYLHRRISYLETSDEDRQRQAQEAKDKASQQVGLKAAFKFIFASRQLKMLVIALVLFMLCVGLTGYSTETMIAYGQSDNNLNLFYIVEPIVYAVFAFFSGFITDKIGRKKSALVFGVMALVFEIIFVVLALISANPWLLALSNGLMYGGLWSFSDLLYIVVPSESAPTHMRATIVSLLQYTAIPYAFLTVIIGVLYQFIGSSRIALLQLAIFVPLMIIVLLFVKKHLKETQGIDLDKAGELE